jgi:malonyl-CoA/methylmalonyl-CoA synthetase
MSGNLYLRIDARVREHSDRCCWSVPGRRNWSWAEVGTAAALNSAALHAAGVRAGDRVLVQVEKSAEALLLYLGCLRAGAVFIPLNTAYTASELEHFLRDAEPRLLVCDPAKSSLLAPLAQRCGVARVETLAADGSGSWSIAVAERGEDASESPIAACGRDDLASIVYTSGTTGRSKGAMLSHRNLESNADALIECWQFRDDDVLLHALPVYHVHGIFVAMHCAMLAGARTILLPKFDVDAVLALLPTSTVFMGVPTFYTRLLADARFDRAAAARVRVFISGSAPLLSATFAEFEQRTGHRILERYGMSEAGIIASNPLHGGRMAGTVGFLLPGVAARVADDAGAELPRGEPGVLEIQGPGVIRGYWRLPERTTMDFRHDGFFITGDLATMDADGRVAIVGRARDLIISGGFNVYPREIELAIDALPGVDESAVIGVPHPDFGEAVVAVVVPLAGHVLDEASLVISLQDRLARFKQPKRVFVVDALPRNAMAKVQKAMLREQYRGAFAPPPSP